MELYRLARDKNALVATHMQVRLDSAHWSLDFIRDIQDWELESITSFLDLLYSTKVRGSGEDPMCWLPSPQKGFNILSSFIKFFPGLEIVPFRGKAFGSLKFLPGCRSFYGLLPWVKY